MIKRFAVPALAILVGAVCFLGTARAHGAPLGNPAPSLGQEHGWDFPPGELNETQRRGFRDGLEGARRDYDNHRPPNVENRDEFRHPDLPGELREAYRDGFRRGYERGVAHFYGSPGGQMREPERAWDAPPEEFNETQRRGFHDGIEGARRDIGDRRRPDVVNREEYRNPPVPPEFRDVYRAGFRRGYEMAISHLMGEAGEQMREPERAWDAPPQEFNEMQRRGFHDGMEGARRDFDNHRQPDPDNRDEFRHPNVPPEFREAYRDGFRRGYKLAISHYIGETEHH